MIVYRPSKKLITMKHVMYPCICYVLRNSNNVKRRNVMLHLKIAKNDQKWLNYVVRQKSLIFGHFSRYSNPRNFLWNIFCHLWGYWLIITDYFSSTFPMLNSHKKNWFFPKMVSQTRFCLFNCFLVYLI